MSVRIPAILAAFVFTIPLVSGDKGAEAISKGKAVLWRAPANIKSRDLIHGIGGREHMPHGPFTFVKEDLKASSPKYNVLDRDGVKWKVKLGPIKAAPAVKDGLVFVGDANGDFHSVNAASGKPIWKFATESEISSGARTNRNP